MIHSGMPQIASLRLLIPGLFGWVPRTLEHVLVPGHVATAWARQGTLYDTSTSALKAPGVREPGCRQLEGRGLRLVHLHFQHHAPCFWPVRHKCCRLAVVGCVLFFKLPRRIFDRRQLSLKGRSWAVCVIKSPTFKLGLAGEMLVDDSWLKTNCMHEHHCRCAGQRRQGWRNSGPQPSWRLRATRRDMPCRRSSTCLAAAAR